MKQTSITIVNGEPVDTDTSQHVAVKLVQEDNDVSLVLVYQDTGIPVYGTGECGLSRVMKVKIKEGKVVFAAMGMEDRVSKFIHGDCLNAPGGIVKLVSY